MSSIELIYDSDKGLFSIAVGLVNFQAKPPRFANAEMFVDTGASVSMISREKAEELGFQVDNLSVVQTGGVTSVKHLRMIPENSGLAILLTNGRRAQPEMRISESLVIEKKRQKGPLVQTRTLKSPPVNLFGLNSLKAVGGRVVIDPNTNPPSGRIEWDE